MPEVVELFLIFFRCFYPSIQNLLFFSWQYFSAYTGGNQFCNLVNFVYFHFIPFAIRTT